MHPVVSQSMLVEHIDFIVDEKRQDMAAVLEDLSPEAVLKITAWHDPVIDALGHDPRAEYAERFWLPVLGPSTLWFLRFCGARLQRSPEGFSAEIGELARRLGLGDRIGRQSPICRTIGRSVDFSMARLIMPTQIEVRSCLPPLARRHLSRLPESLRDEHARLTSLQPIAASRLNEPAHRLSDTLFALGEDRLDVERQLHTWHFPNEIIAECLREQLAPT